MALLLLGACSENAAGGAFVQIAGTFDSGPGDAGVAFVGGRRFAIYLDFDSNEIVCRDANAAFNVISRQPTGPQPRQMIVVDNRFVVVANSGDNTISAYVIGEDGQLTRTSQVSSGGLEPFDVGLFLTGAIYVVNRGSDELSSFELDALGQLSFLGKVPTGPDPDLVDVSSRGTVVVGNSGDSTLSTYRVDWSTKVAVKVGIDYSLGYQARSLSFSPNGRELFVAERSQPGTEDRLHAYTVGPVGSLTHRDSWAAGRFLTDLAVTPDRLYAVTVNSSNRDEVRAYRREGLQLSSFASFELSDRFPSFKQVAVGLTQERSTAVLVNEFQSGYIGLLDYSRNSDPACNSTWETLCLGMNRFELTVDFEAPAQGVSGTGKRVPVTSDTGGFWFFNDSNIELMVKVLDGRTINGRFWTLYGALSNVKYSLNVVDVSTGRVRTYLNEDGSQASAADTSAFPTGSSAAKAQSAALLDVPRRSQEELYALLSAGQRARAPVEWAACAPGSALLCLTQNRFQIQVDWRVPSQGRSGSGTAVAITGDTGYFWFFDSANVELIIKVLDARVINGKFWVFYGALSNVEYTITVTDTETGAVKAYANPSGTLASAADTSAF
jgi:6-phosphogluconolactonase (cycloisomerase 2 family)